MATKSSLACVTILSPNHYASRNGYRVVGITPHYMAGNCTVETCGQIFLPLSRRASSNYGIGSDGRVACYVYEEYAAWTSGNKVNDSKNITIECANVANKSLTNACWNSLVSLCVDICRRYGFRLNYTGDTSGNLTKHKWFQATDCPGTWLDSQFERLAQEVNAKLDGGVIPTVKPHNNAQGGKLDVDGYAGYNTILDLQAQLNSYRDGVMSGQFVGNQKYIRSISSIEWGAQGSPMVARLQAKVGTYEDGIWGHDTSKCVQEQLERWGYPVGVAGIDGYFGPDSAKALQRSLNDKRWA